ncbi:hypothetical protein HH310_06925 [Actinoplanes sp. TBRC 11911]|nr:hypothetical protein [Actinoplanes sp. TBRC 11911]
MNALNENVYKFLALYQTLATALVGAGLALFVGYRKWGISPSVANAATVALLWLLTFVAFFTALLLVVGMLNWIDYRNEECDLTDRIAYRGFRQRPKLRNLFRWYETYILLFIIGSVVFVWVYASTLLLPNIH